MIDILTSATEILTETGFTAVRASINGREALAFEDATVLGFLFAYGDSSELIGAWEKDASSAIAEYHGLRAVNWRP